MNRKVTRIISVVLCVLFLALPTTVCATSGDTGGDGSDIFDKIFDAMANADVSDDDVANTNEELTGNANYNPLQNAKDSLSKTFAAFSGKEYDEDDFGGKADEVYGAIGEAGEKVTNSGILDKIWNFAMSFFRLIANWFSSIGSAMKK